MSYEQDDDIFPSNGNDSNGFDYSSADDSLPHGMSPESWVPPTAPGLLASSLEIGTQPWVRNEWKVVDEDGEEVDEETGLIQEFREEERKSLIPERTASNSKQAPPLPKLDLGALKPNGKMKSPRPTSPRYVNVTPKKPIDELWLEPSKSKKKRDERFGPTFAKLLGRWASLANAPRELWILYGLKFLSSYAYFSLMLILTMFLTDEFQYSDTAAGWTYGMYGLMSTFYGLLCGWFIDYMGVRRSLAVGSFFGAIARGILAFTPYSKAALLILYTILPFSECLGIPIMSIGIKRYTNSKNRTYAFSLFYSMMNMAAFVTGPAVDFARIVLAKGVGFDLGAFGYTNAVHLSSLRLVILSGAISTALMFIIVIYFVREIDVDAHGNVRAFTPIQHSPWEQTKQVLGNPVFWRLTLFTFLLVGVRLVFRHLDATFPKYLVRAFGETAPYGMIYAINPLLIIFLVPIVGLMTRHVHSFTMIRYGTIVAAASPFFMCLGSNYFSVVLFMIALSIGEAVYSPRVYEYTMEVSGHGAEGLYSSLAAAPLFSVQLIVGGMSGWLLTTYMPRHGVHRGRTLWSIIGATAMTSPIFISLLKDYIHPEKEQVKAISLKSEDLWEVDVPKTNYGTIRKSKSLPTGTSKGSNGKAGLKRPQKAATRPAGRPPTYPKQNRKPQPNQHGEFT